MCAIGMCTNGTLPNKMSFITNKNTVSMQNIAAYILH